MNGRNELYQQVILEHNRKPRNFKRIEDANHVAEGYNPLCGDHLTIFMNVDESGVIQDISFEGTGCAISKASASMMTVSLKGKKKKDALLLFDEFHNLLLGKLNPDTEQHHLGKLSIFSGVWQYPARVKCASLAWHAMKGALEKVQSVSTES